MLKSQHHAKKRKYQLDLKQEKYGISQTGQEMG
jgi:hypothetical protein